MKAFAIFGIFFVMMAHIDRVGFWRGVLVVGLSLLFALMVHYVDRKGDVYK